MSQAVNAQQDGPQSVRQRLKAERVQVVLQEMPAWKLREGGRSIDRAFQFPSPRVADAYASFVSAFASESGQAVNLDLNKGQVVVTLSGPRVKGRQLELNEEILTFARRLG